MHRVRSFRRARGRHGVSTRPAYETTDWGILVVGMLLLLLLLIVVFGGLGIFVAKVFLVALAVMILISFITGGYYMRGR